MPYKDPEKQKEAQHQSYLKNKKVVKERNKEKKERNKKYLYEYKLERGCQMCGENHPATLSFHHLGNKKDNISKMQKTSSLNSIKKEIENCIVVCENCHRIIHFEFDTERRWKEIEQIENPRLKRMEIIRRKVFEYKSTQKCKECGEYNPFKLEFHHIISDNKKMSVSDLIHLQHSEKMIFEEIEKCEILCANCHRKRHSL